MESSILKQIARFLQEQKKQKRWLVVFLCLAIIVGFGTVTALKMRGQAMTHKEKRVICQLAVHQHADECYDENKENLICGYADYVVHVHNEDCYDWNGNLTCQLPEVEKHEHSEECYTEEATLICGLEETAGHQHGAECYTTQQGGLICQVPEHTHAAECYDETGAVICGLEEHIHEDACYEWTDVLICQLAEGADGHTHTEACYEVKEILSCGKLELHTHTDACYEKINEEEELSETNRRLVCTIPVLEEHIHTEDAGCLETVEVTANGELVEEGTVEEETTEGETEEEIFTTDLDGEDAEAEDAEAEAEEEDAEEADIEEKTYEETKTYKGDGYVVTVSYNKDANIPEEAELIAEQVTKENDADRYAAHEAQAREMMGGNGNGRNALFKIGFYIEKDGEKKEIEPETPVAVTIQFMDKDGMLEGSPITVIHFAENGNEVLDGSNIEEGSTTFEMESFSYLWLEIEPRETEINEDGTAYISESYEYEAAPFLITFHIEGEVPISGEENGEMKDESEGTEDVLDEMDGADTSEEEDVVETEETDTSGMEEDAAGEEEGALQNNLEWNVEPLEDGSEIIQVVKKYLGKSDAAVEKQILHTLTYGVTYKGEPLDLTDCTVTAKITPLGGSYDEALETLEEKTSEGVEKKASVILYEVLDNHVKKLGEVSSEKSEDVSDETDSPEESAEPDVEVTLDSDNLVMAESQESNPEYTVQYYAYAQTLETENKTGQEGIDAIKIIDTTGKTLPNNQGMPKTKNMYVKYTGQNASYSQAANGKKAWEIYEPLYKEMEDSLTKIYLTDQYHFVDAPNLENIDKFTGDGLNYDLYEVWVLKEGGNADSDEKKDWNIYTEDKLDTLKFSNNSAAQGEDIINITSDTVIRLVGKSNTGYYNNDAKFFDYDFTNGARESGQISIREQGINSPINYKGTGAKLAVGNNSSGPTGLEVEKHSGYYINQAVKPNDAYAKTIIEKCAFGLAKPTLDKDGNLALNVNAPDLFGTGSVLGKTEIPGFSLDFMRDGDTYTLTSAKGSNGGIQNLQNFQKGVGAYMTDGWTSQGGGDQIWTNQFWPMDYADTFGKDGHDLKFGDSTQKWMTTDEKNMIASDDGEDHNSFFGMNFAVQFRLTDDYVGPLNYYFFGDDDMWVYLVDEETGESNLVCDIGGVHQAAGEYVNLWDYIARPEEQNTATGRIGTDTEHERGKLYTLKFFYTERGASGSTCWMQFTLPSVNAVPVDYGNGDCKNTLHVSKSVEGSETDEAFEFTIEFETQNGVNNTYAYEILDKDGKKKRTGSIASGESFFLKNGDSIIVRNLPDGARYEIKEKRYDGYEAESSGTGVISTGQTTEGTIDWDRDDQVGYINKEIPYELPETGGSGPIIYTMAGVLAILSGAGFMYRKKVRERRV